MSDPLPICGRRCPAEGLYLNWPIMCCTLAPGHECDHQYDRGDGVSFEWPIMREELTKR